MNPTPNFFCRACGRETNGAILRPIRSGWGRVLTVILGRPDEYRGCPRCGSEDLLRFNSTAAFIARVAHASGSVPKPPFLHFEVVEEILPGGA